MRSRAAEELEASSFDEFEKILRDLEERRAKQQEAANFSYVSNYLYRGQADSTWGLKTTLERAGMHDCTFERYYHLVARIKPHLESLSNTRWPSLDWTQVQNELDQKQATIPGFLPAYDLLVHLRHHGFPSPLLDWSASPYVALFFAMRAASDSKYASVHIYQDHAGRGKVGGSGSPTIDRRGPYVTTHRRHALQQAEYTICARRFDRPMCFASHDEAFAGEYPSDEQDLLWKIAIPTRISRDVLRRLDQFNLNAYSLFGSEEALLETLFLREGGGNG